MILTTKNTIENRKIAKELGIVAGNVVKSKVFYKDILARIRNIFGMELIEYTELLKEARGISIDRMKDEAKKLGANAIVCVRFETNTTSEGTGELMAYGTAVLLK